MIQLLRLVNRLASEIDAELVEHVDVDGAHHSGRMSVAVNEISNLLHRKLCDRVGGSADGKRDKYLIRMKSGVMVA